MSKKNEIEELREIIAMLMKRVDELTLKNREIKYRLSKYLI